jgi:5,6-dimethylbenzimidazole synthase
LADSGPDPINPTSQFDEAFRDQLTELIRWRRDVRRFRTDPVPGPLLDELFDLACLAPSVGNSQPWRFVRVISDDKRAALLDNFKTANKDALDGYGDEHATLYAKLKLSGLQEAPILLATFTDGSVTQGHGLGRQTMPETLDYSTVSAIHTLWLAARAEGLGVGWVSIIDPKAVTKSLDVPSGWRFTALLCIGWPSDTDTVPELERAGWQARDTLCRKVLER